MRYYEIKEEPDGFQFRCDAKPPDPVQWGHIEWFIFTKLTEPEAHKAAIFARTHEDTNLYLLYREVGQLLGVDTYG